jgi:hypothetical protein
VGDTRAAYAIYDGDRLEFKRVDYDRQATQAKLSGLPLDDETKAYLHERLDTGD